MHTHLAPKAADAAVSPGSDASAGWLATPENRAFPPDIFARRRQQLCSTLRAAGGGLALISAAPMAQRSRDTDYDYRQDSNFFYLTGFTEPDALLLLDARSEKPVAHLFCREKDPQREVWEGFHYGPEAACTVFGFDAAFPNSERDTRILQQLDGCAAVFYPLYGKGGLDADVRRWVETLRARRNSKAPVAVQDLASLVEAMRVVKDRHELDRMRQAARISALAHKRAMRAGRPGLPEYAIEAELLYEFRRHGAQAPAYGSIVAAGANACILHYPAGDKVLADGDLVLIDAACELDGYASDITRTWPASGRFTGPQRTLYDIVLAAHAAAAANTRAGARFDDGHTAALKVLVQGMLDTGLLRTDAQGGVDDIIADRSYSRFYMHRTGHWLGMDVHDCGDYTDAGADNGAVPPLSRRLEAGMVLTIEPGLYVRRADDVPEAFWDTGIRIEDDAVVTATGCELITQDVPVDADAIEALMREER